MTCRKVQDDVETRGNSLTWDKSEGWPDCRSDGIRHEGGVTLKQASVWNAGTCSPDAKGEIQIGGPYEDESSPPWPISFFTMRSTCGWSGTSRTYHSSADDAICHCCTEGQATALRNALEMRFADCGLTLHPEKTKIVYCIDESRRENHPIFKFDFLGYNFRSRMVSKRYWGMGVSFSPAVSPTALKAIRRTVRSWAMHRRSDKALDDLARMFNSHIRGWINYYGRFCPSALYPTLRHIDLILARWVAGRFKSMRGHRRRTRHWLARIALQQPRLFAHWSLIHGGGRTMGAG